MSALHDVDVRLDFEGLKKGKAPGADNIPAELLTNGGDSACRVLWKICQEVWKKGKWPKSWTESLIITIPKKGNLRKCSNYRTISLISHPSKVLLQILLADSDHKWRVYSEKNRQALKPEEVPRNKFLIYEF